MIRPRTRASEILTHNFAKIIIDTIKVKLCNSTFGFVGIAAGEVRVSLSLYGI